MELQRFLPKVRRALRLHRVVPGPTCKPLKAKHFQGIARRVLHSRGTTMKASSAPKRFLMWTGSYDGFGTRGDTQRCRPARPTSHSCCLAGSHDSRGPAHTSHAARRSSVPSGTRAHRNGVDPRFACAAASCSVDTEIFHSPSHNDGTRSHRAKPTRRAGEPKRSRRTRCDPNGSSAPQFLNQIQPLPRDWPVKRMNSGPLPPCYLAG